jgi:hypothetical protein
MVFDWVIGSYEMYNSNGLKKIQLDNITCGIFLGLGIINDFVLGS